MERQVYDKRAFRNLPRDRCALQDIFGPEIGPCKGLIHLHHTDPSDPDSRLLPCCNSHHQRLHAALRALLTPSEPEWRTCTHKHRYPEGKAACERRLNGVDSEARKAPVSLGGEPSAAVEDPGTAEAGAFSPLETAA